MNSGNTYAKTWFRDEAKLEGETKLSRNQEASLRRTPRKAGMTAEYQVEIVFDLVPSDRSNKVNSAVRICSRKNGTEMKNKLTQNNSSAWSQLCISCRTTWLLLSNISDFTKCLPQKDKINLL